MLRKFRKWFIEFKCSTYTTQVYNHFGFLAAEYGFQIQRDEGSRICKYVAKKENCRVDIYVTGIEVSATIEVTGREKEKLEEKGLEPRALEFGILAECFDPNLVHPIRYKMLSANALSLLAGYAKKYGKRMLDGDFSEWPFIEKRLEERAVKIKEHFQEIRDKNNPI